jgi:hypothetical protein
LIKLVSETPADEIERKRLETERERAEVEIIRNIRELAANMMRIVAGAGQPESVAPQMHAALKAMLPHIKEYNPDASDALVRRALQLDNDIDYEREDASYVRGEQLIRQGAVRYEASALLDQRVQCSRAEVLMNKGERIRERWRTEQRKKMRAITVPGIDKPERFRKAPNSLEQLPDDAPASAQPLPRVRMYDGIDDIVRERKANEKDGGKS